ncbi:MAG: single-stranded-DNA-specific exonuclease RecJ [Oscillospiraceae bacterium]|nr:single-stranded-DNA-specific exonuclease RecJ [Oscillospiraceae bacterium]
MLKKWIVKDSRTQEPFILPEIVNGLGKLVRDILISREICDEESVHAFFNSDTLFDPLLMKDMGKAVDLIKDALSTGKKITVYGDYDCDGITSTVMLYSYLTALGGEADWYIPSRDEGYGLNNEAVEKIANGGTELIITADNGVTAFSQAELIREKGISLIITDHHNCPDKLPTADAVVNPKQKDCSYPFKELAGCGVVLKLICALENSNGFDVIEQYGDLAAIGTIADIVPLAGKGGSDIENRSIVTLGLRGLECSENIGLRSLMKKAGLSNPEEISSTEVAFILCPRINAAGRFAHPAKAVELLLCENHETASAKAEELCVFNSQRIEEERRIIAQIEEVIKKSPSLLNERILILSGKDWHHGIIGIIASRMVTRFGKTCVIITMSEGQPAKGSCRAVKGFSIHEMLTFCSETPEISDKKESLLLKFGGHAGAGGFSAENDNIPALTERILQYAERFHNTVPVAEIAADCVPNAADITAENVEKLDTLQPFGEGNPPPVFFLPECLLKHKRPLKEGKYTSMTIVYQNREFKVLDFSKCYADFWYKVGDKIDLMLSFSLNEYNGETDVSMKIIDIRLCGITSMQDRIFAAKDVYEKIAREEFDNIDPKLYSRIIPSTADMKRVYGIVRDSFCMDMVCQKSLIAGINYCMLRVIIDIFEGAGLVEYNRVSDYIKVIETSQKTDLEKSELLIKLKEIRELKEKTS